MKIAVFGAGAWGSAVAAQAAPRHDVLLWARDGAQAAAITASRRNERYLPGIELPPQLRCSAQEAKDLLRSNTDAAAQQGVFGVPTFEVDGHLFWGLDSLPMLRAYLQGGDGWFEGSAWDAAPSVPSGLPPAA